MRLRILLAAIAAGSAMTLPALAGELQVDGDAWWALTPLSLEVENGGVATVGFTYSTTVLQTDDPMFANLGQQCINWGEPDGTGRGRCVLVAPDGDRWFEFYVCDTVIDPPRGELFAAACVTTITGGTGKFATLTGTGTWTSLVTAIAPDGTVVGHAPIHYDLQW